MQNIPVVILAGGRGTRLGELTGVTPKPMVKIGEEPIIWHIMKWFMKYGSTEFYILTGYLHEEIERYFLHKGYAGSSKITVSDVEIKGEKRGKLGCTVHLIDTGEKTGIAARVKKAEKELSGRRFILTYGDGLGDVDMKKLVAAHDEAKRKKGAIVTISAVQPRSKFGVVDLKADGTVSDFREKPLLNDWINIGYSVVEPALFGYLAGVKESDMLERDIYPKIALEGKINAYRHPGEFHAMDTYGDFVELNALWSQGKAFWKGLTMGKNMGSLGAFFKGKRVLVTGNTGFKGSWLTHILLGMGAEVFGYSLEPDTDPSMFSATGLDGKITTHYSDIRDFDALKSAFSGHKPEIVFHLAAQPLVRRSYYEPKYTFEANLMGTVNVLECLRQAAGVKSAVLVTTDKVYRQNGGKAHAEGDELGGDDPYSASKACCELAINSYRKSFGGKGASAGKSGKALFASARAGNVIGGGDWADDRLVPDIVRSRFAKKSPLVLRNPEAVRPWQHVLDPLAGYLYLAKSLYEGKAESAGAWNFAPQQGGAVTVREVVSAAESIIGKCDYRIRPDTAMPETKMLALDAGKAVSKLGWKPKIGIKKALEMTFEWYSAYYSGGDCAGLTVRQIEGYFQ